MKLLIQIPCLNEEDTLEATLRELPKSIPGIDVIEILIIDDGCTDRTVDVALANGVQHVVHFRRNRGLGYAFAAGIDACLQLGADIIVNTDGDNQYCGADVTKLVQPILDGKADFVIGDRQTDRIAHFSPLKKRLQKLGSYVVSHLANLSVPDVASGFRAYSRDAALMLTCSTDFDHTVDHVIQAGRKRIATVSVPIGTNGKLRESRLFSNIGVFVSRSLGVMVRVYSSYRALKIFSILGATAITIGTLIGLRFVAIFLFYPEQSKLHTQSLILAAILLIAGVQMILTGIVADLMNSLRSITEEILRRQRTKT